MWSVTLWTFAKPWGAANLYDEVDVAVWIGDVENGRPGKAGHASLFFAVPPLLLDVWSVAVQVEWLGDFLFLLGIVKSHHRKHRFNAKVKPIASQIKNNYSILLTILISV